MPEIIEVRRCADFIRKKLKNNEIINVNILGGRYKNKGPFAGYKKLRKNMPTKLIDVQTKGKLMYLIFDNDMYLVNRLGLVGGWCFLKNNSSNYEHTDTYKYYARYGDKEMMKTYIKNSLNHLNFEIVTQKGTLYYYDVLSYGTLLSIDSDNDLNKILDTLGPDIMDEDTTLEIFRDRVLKKNNLEKAIGNVIVNQKIISGLGNYLRTDILWLSEINPFKKVKNLYDDEIEDIYHNSKTLTWGLYDRSLAIKLKIIKKSTKLPSDYDRLFYIYMQEEDIYGNRVFKKELFDGSQKRFISYVPAIQK